MNDLLSLAVAVFKVTARFSESKMTARMGPVPCIREKPSSSPRPPHFKSSRARGVAGRKCKTAVSPVQGESWEARDDFADPEGCSPSQDSSVTGLYARQLATDVTQVCSGELSDSSLGGKKGKLQWLFEQDKGSKVSTSPSIDVMLGGHEYTDPSTLCSRFPRTEFAPDDSRSSVEECLAHCRPLFGNGRNMSKGCALDPLDCVVFHRFMVNSQGDLFDYDLQSAQFQISKENFPGAAFCDGHKHGRPPALGLELQGARESPQGQEDSLRFWKGQVQVLKQQCDLLYTEKEDAVKRWKQECLDTDEALQTVHSLRMAVDSLMGSKQRGHSKRRGPYTADGECRAAASHRRVNKLRRGSVYRNDSVSLPQRLNDAEALEGRLEKRRRGRCKVSDHSNHRSLGIQSEEELQVKFGAKLEVASSSSTLSLVNALFSTWLSRDDTEVEKVSFSLPRLSSGDSMLRKYTAAETDSPSALSNQKVEVAKVGEEPEAEDQSFKLGNGCFLSETATSAANPQERVPPTQVPKEQSIDPAENERSDQTMAAVRDILRQFHAENEQWSQVQDILRNVSDDMENLFVSCREWEERALHAEALSSSLLSEVSEWQSRAQEAEQKVCDLESNVDELRATTTEIKEWQSKAQMSEKRFCDLESRMLELRATAGQVAEWRSKAQAAEQKVCELEAGMSHLKAIVEQVKGRHAMEQSRLLEAGTRLRHTAGTPLSCSMESPKSGVALVEFELQESGAVKVPTRRSPTSGEGSSRLTYGLGLDKKTKAMGTCKHRRSVGLHNDFDMVELSQYLSMAHPDDDAVVERGFSVSESSERQGLEEIGNLDQKSLAGTGKSMFEKGPTDAGGAVRYRDVKPDFIEVRQQRYPIKAINSPTPVSKPGMVGLDRMIKTSGPLRHKAESHVVKGADPYPTSERKRNGRSRRVDITSKISRGRRASREDGASGLRRANTQNRPFPERESSTGNYWNYGGRSWDADEDRSEFASPDYSSDAPSECTFESAEEDYGTWNVGMLDSWKEPASNDLSKVRRKYQLPTQQERVSSGTAEVAAWKQHMSTKKPLEVRPEAGKMKLNVGSEKVKTAIPTFQSLFPGKLRRKNEAKVVKERSSMGQSGGYESTKFPSSPAPERDTSAPKSRGSFLNGIQKQFLVRNSPSHPKQIPPGQALESSQELKKKPWKEKKNEGSFLEDIRRHLKGKSQLQPGKDRSRPVSPFAGDGQQMRSLMSSPVRPRPPLSEIMGNASEFLGSRAFYSG